MSQLEVEWTPRPQARLTFSHLAIRLSSFVCSSTPCTLGVSDFVPFAKSEPGMRIPMRRGLLGILATEVKR